jgi:predicted nucleotidyltransferase
MPRIPTDERELREFCSRHRIRTLSLFGSTLAGTAKSTSDIDLLVEFEAGQKPGLIGLAKMEAELSQLLAGRKVDLRTYEELSHRFRDEVARTAEVQYAGE